MAAGADEVICYTTHLLSGEERSLSFMDILLDDRWAEGEIRFLEPLFAEVGGFNTRLHTKQTYELLLRVAEHYPVKAVGIAEEKCNCILQEDTWEAFRTDCYVAGKYQQELLDSEYFNPVIESLFIRAKELGYAQEGIEWLEKMIARAPEYYEIYDNTQPILIYKTDDTVCNLLNVFAEQLALSFQAYQQRVEIFDVQKEGNGALTRYIGKRFKAIIGIQSYVFSIMMQDCITNLHDLISGPKYNMILDHPAWMKEHIAMAPKDYHLLIHDRNYLAFADRYFKNIGANHHFSPAGVLPEIQGEMRKEYDISFIGTYYDYRKRLAVIGTYGRRQRFFMSRYMNVMKKHPNMTAESAFEQTLDYYGIQVDDEGFLSLFYEFREACFCIMSYYREKTMQTLLDGGICLHVFGDSWANSPFMTHENFIYHPSIGLEESMEVMKKSKLSLNIMSWHMDGFTERAAHTLLCHSVLLSSKSTYLEEDFRNGDELVLFDLERLEELPTLVEKLLEDETKLMQIAARGYQKALQNHLWKHRGEQLLFIIEEDKKRDDK